MSEKVGVVVKKKDDLPEVVVVSDRILYLRVCAAIPPEEVGEKLEDAIAAAGINPGLVACENRWKLPDEDFYKVHPEARPVPCADYEGRWHYILICYRRAD